ncbi:uncharacterized protein PAC_15493 [Phialocephala subalpina]|uniref:SsuA/THI5-like domain-containing protein n=1 Tax=Phialocephala subalpina TaxID=576137 RepID=A0A1L7XKQ1_9HELO|nr:uncharacterized protein PAC_15493 [Phialocephala subalpina]
MGQMFFIIGLTLLFSYTFALRIAGNLQVIEYTPELIASQDYFNGSTVSFVNGGVATIVTDTSIDLAANAETQALRQFSPHKNLRIIYTVVEVYYRIVANKKTISTVKDLKGKKIATFSGTSAAERRNPSSPTILPSQKPANHLHGCRGLLPDSCEQEDDQYREGLERKEDCNLFRDECGVFRGLIFWGNALGSDAIVLQDRSVYREIFNLHSTKEKLADPATRKSIVAFLRALTQAEKVFINTPEKIWPRVAKALNMNETIIKDVWPVHSWNGSIVGGLPSDLLSVLVAEDQWVAKQDRRTTMAQSDLATLIDDSVLKEAMQIT